MKDVILFGNAKSETEHLFKNGGTVIVKGEMGESARKALPTSPCSRYGGELTFTMEVDPVKQNYISVKLWGEDMYSQTHVYLDGKRVGYGQNGDYEALNNCHGGFLSGRFFYCTQLLPLHYTKGKTRLEITLRQSERFENLTEPKGRFFRAYTHTEAVLNVDDEPQGKLGEVKVLPHREYTKAEIDSMAEKFVSAQRDVFLELTQKMRRGELLSVTKYVEEMRQYVMTLHEDYCPLKSKREKKEALELLLWCINEYVKLYYNNVRTLARTTHQSDWGGYYGDLGQTLYIAEPFINDDEILGRAAFEKYLGEPLGAESIDGEYSLSDKGVSRFEGWERCLKANFDFASARQSYIYNQTYYTYEGAWKSMAGLGVLKSRYYIGDEKCRRLLKEALGMCPWLGEHILTDKNNRELDLYHCLFNHDKMAVFTDDFYKVVCRGEAKQLLDENGEFVRRKPYGENYIPLSCAALSRENGYVGNYGETNNYLFEWVYRTWNHGDRDLSDEILKIALKNINSRSYMRYMDLDENGYRMMRMEQFIDERNPWTLGKPAYGAIIDGNRGFGFASLEMHMHENKERYALKEWDEYKKYAARCVGFVMQQRLDGRLDCIIENLAASYTDYRQDKTIKWIMEKRPLLKTGVVPQWDSAYYSDEEIAALGENPEEYKEFAFADLDNMLLSLRDDENHVHLYAQLNERNRGFGANGRVHLMKNNYTCLMQVETDGIFSWNEYFIRQQSVNMDYYFDSDALEELKKVPQALAGEVQPITYQRGIGKVLRENYEVDTPYSGYPDLLTARIGRYFVIFNTTRSSYKNSASFKVKLPSGENRAYDMVSKREMATENGSVEVPPFTAVVLRLQNEAVQEQLPATVKVMHTICGGNYVLLWFKETSLAQRYRIYRNGRVIGETEENVFRDENVKSGEKYEYTVCGVNSLGEGVGCSETITFAGDGKTKWIFAQIGSARGSAKIDEIGESIEIDGSGEGFGKGDDYKSEQRRKIKDSICYVATAVSGQMSISAAVRGGGLMIRESMDESARYCYFDGKKVYVRNKNTIYQGTGNVESPKVCDCDGEERYIKLVCDKALHTCCAMTSSDKKVWKEVWRGFVPLSENYYIGFASTAQGSLTELEIKEEITDRPFPIEQAWVEIKEHPVIRVKMGYDNRKLLLERQDGDKWIKICESFSQTMADENAPKGENTYRITAFNRHDVASKEVYVKIKY